MECINRLVTEHDNIQKMLQVIRNASLQILNGEEVDVPDFRKMVSFIRNYADKTHHGKEEEFLFREMLDKMGSIGENLVRHGMLVEHDLGRLYVSDLEDALTAYEGDPTPENKLSILVSAGSYANLLERHIDKENNLVFTFAAKKLDNESLQWVEEQSLDFEKNPENAAVQKAQLQVLEELIQKYPGA